MEKHDSEGKAEQSMRMPKRSNNWSGETERSRVKAIKQILDDNPVTRDSIEDAAMSVHEPPIVPPARPPISSDGTEGSAIQDDMETHNDAQNNDIGMGSDEERSWGPGLPKRTKHPVPRLDDPLEPY